LARDHRRLAAIVSADVVGYSLLMGRDDSATLAGLKAHRRELIDPKIAEYGGRIVKTTGDGLLLEFPSVVDAEEVGWAMLQRCRASLALGRRNCGLRKGHCVGQLVVASRLPRRGLCAQRSCSRRCRRKGNATATAAGYFDRVLHGASVFG